MPRYTLCSLPPDLVAKIFRLGLEPHFVVTDATDERDEFKINVHQEQVLCKALFLAECKALVHQAGALLKRDKIAINLRMAEMYERHSSEDPTEGGAIDMLNAQHHRSTAGIEQKCLQKHEAARKYWQDKKSTQEQDLVVCREQIAAGRCKLNALAGLLASVLYVRGREQEKY